MRKDQQTNGSPLLKVRAERLRRRWRQEDLAYWSRISAAEISRIETGRLRPYPGQVEKLARALEIDPATLLDKVHD